MKKIFVLLLLFFVCCTYTFSQWQLSLTLNLGETIADISAPADNVIWAVTNSFFIYKTSDAGNNWKRTKCNGLATNISVLHLYVVDATTAFLSVNTNFTGVGPGIIYKTIDGGSNWTQVFSHKGNCEILIGMFDDNKGVMNCYFDSFDGSIPSGQTLYYTTNGGSKWNVDPLNPSKNIINNVETKSQQLSISDYSNFYWSPKYGLSYTTKDVLSHNSEPKRYLQVVDSNYAIISSGNVTDLLIKRPATRKWIDLGVPQNVIPGAVTGIILDGAECWFSEAFDTNKLYYSSDSAKTFTATIPVLNSSFQFLIKSRNSKTLIGGTPSFSNGQIWLNKRQTNITRPPLNYEERQKAMQ
jgi:photosystem II stability/assembly factor-like uncharacterized protein